MESLRDEAPSGNSKVSAGGIAVGNRASRDSAAAGAVCTILATYTGIEFY